MVLGSSVSDAHSECVGLWEEDRGGFDGAERHGDL